MRRLIPLLLAAVLVAAGCGTERPGAARDAGATFSPAPSATPTPTPAPTPTPTPTRRPGEPSGPLAGFPLALGYDDENHDDHSPVKVTDQAALGRIDNCGLVWDPNAGTTDLIGVEFRGEAEWVRRRTLVLYPSEDAAAEAVSTAHDAIVGCPDQPGEEEYGTTHDLLDIPLGDESVVWADTYYFTSEGEKLHDTGLTVYHLVRVGRAVLASLEYGEGNGSRESRRRSIAEATDAVRPVVDRMRELPGEAS